VILQSKNLQLLGFILFILLQKLNFMSNSESELVFSYKLKQGKISDMVYTYKKIFRNTVHLTYAHTHTQKKKKKKKKKRERNNLLLSYFIIFLNNKVKHF